MTKGCFSNGRLRKISIARANLAHNAKTVDLENYVLQSSLVMALPFLVETPWMTISIIERTRACSPRCYLAKSSVLKAPLRSSGADKVNVLIRVFVLLSRVP